MKVWYNNQRKNQAVLLTDRVSRRYFSGVDVAEGFLLLCDKSYYFSDARYYYALRLKLKSCGIIPILYTGLECINNILKNEKIKTLYVDFEKTSVKEYKDYRIFKVKLKDYSDTLKNLRSVKSDAELEKIERACTVVQNAYYRTIKHLKPGITEKQVAEILEREMIENGAESVAFDTIVAFGKNSAVPHHETGETVLSTDMPVLIDVGCKVDGYCSDLTRTLFFGTPSEKFKSCYQAVLQANLRAIEKITAGMKTDIADGIARNTLKNNHMEQNFTHSLGHGVGLDIHEFPSLSPKKCDVLKNDMVFTIEPGVYFDGEFGIRIEDTVRLSDGKIKRLFTDEKKLIIL